MKRHNLLPIVMGCVMLAVLTTPVARAQSGIEPQDFQRNGLAGWQFLKINPSPRQAALGGTYTGLTEVGAEAVFGNPATLASTASGDLFLSRVNWVADIGVSAGSIAHRIGNAGVLGVSVVALTAGDIEETINQVVPGGDRTEAVITGETYTSTDLAVGVSFARNVTDRLAVGGTLRYIRESIADVDMNNVSLDFGTTYYTGFRSLRLSLAARNLGPDVNLAGWSEEYQADAVDIRMPIDYRVGLAMDFFESATDNHAATVLVEGIHPNDGPERINAGLEYTFMDALSLRGGYRFNYDEEQFTLGAGVKYATSTYGLKLNYAFVDFGRLSQVHMVSLGIQF